ncbi:MULTISPECIES: NRAMP family divalent metal transporter [unclassified Lysinibacillus]|uniref:NRAMP family divalent metal transporter n=1 Tax=unclassified Lysinibacillus TaxID=2636778 RepID=UPI00201162DA|nr:NRAMP family divalent metal transporter [Lysinibacillus sp. BPa_S21]MCL1696103.1 divalent metal cation transporter [Lysinibacillus sp. BPa_S21]MCL1700522.1 divalent metal cation transporter [Lysinibacillus sp. Bpr_S20]
MEQEKKGAFVKKTASKSVLIGAAFLMATSSIGPGFLTQTTVFTQQLAASFGFVILISLILDIVAQVNVWRIIAVSGLRGQEIANKVLPGLGVLLAIMIVIGGLAFNIGNVAGAGLGLNAMLGVEPIMGAILSALFAIFIFIYKEAGKAMDKVAQIAGGVMILLMLFVAFKTSPPVGEAIVNTVWPKEISWFAIVTLVGGSVGGYITFAGGHRLLDAGIKGQESLPEVTKSSVTGILITGVMRIALFLAVLGVVSKGLVIDPANPPASVFQLAAGNIGYRMFGMIMWAAAITSVVGAAYTSVSFIRTFHPSIEKYHNWVIIAFIVISTTTFALVGKPVNVLILVGALNALILPLALGIILVAAHKKEIVGTYKHPRWLTVTGAIVVVLMGYLSIITLIEQIPKIFS